MSSNASIFAPNYTSFGPPPFYFATPHSPIFTQLRNFKFQHISTLQSDFQIPNTKFQSPNPNLYSKWLNFESSNSYSILPKPKFDFTTILKFYNDNQKPKFKSKFKSNFPVKIHLSIRFEFFALTTTFFLNLNWNQSTTEIKLKFILHFSKLRFTV